MQHDPTREAQSALERREGGRLSGIVRRVQREQRATTAPGNLPPFDPDTLERVALWHQWASRAVATGEISARTGDAICRHLRELRPVLINLGMEVRVRELERALKAARKELDRRGH